MAVPSQGLLGPVATNGFPARRLTKPNYGGGEWVTAYQAEQRSKLKTVFLTQHQSLHDGGWGSLGHLSPPTNTREPSGVPKKTLDKKFLMRHCFVEQPTDLSDADISGVHLTTCKPDDYVEFDNLVHMNASDTSLPLEAFKGFPVLEQLELLVCSITDISLTYKDFSNLQFLDLSYNSVSGMAVLTLGTLPRLRELHLTGNNIVALPVEMSRQFRTNMDTSDRGLSLRMRFAALETLWLDDNKLTDQTTFSTLAGLRKLKYVNLDNNELYIVPHLRLIGTSPLKSPPQGTRSTHRRRSLTPKNRAKVSSAHLNESRKTASVTPSTQRISTEVNIETRSPEKRDEEEKGKVGASDGERRDEAREETLGEDPKIPPGDTPASVSQLPPSMAPFPHLHTLSLANNLFFTSEDLLACGSWPSLKQMIIHGNPLVSMCNGMPRCLQIELVQKCNIDLVRHKPSVRAPFRIGKKAKQFKKVSSDLPVIPKQSPPALPPLETPLMINAPSSPSPPSSTTHETSYTSTTTVEHQADSEASVFITQGMGEHDDMPAEKTVIGGRQKKGREEKSVREEMRLWKRELRTKYSEVPEYYRGYEALLEDNPGPTPPIPTDLYGCVHALRYALKHATPAPRTTVLSVHTHRDHRNKDMDLTSSLVTSTHRKVQRIHTALNEVRNSTAILEANLAEVLKMDTSKTTTDKKSQKLQKEGQHLLKQLQAKYDDVQRTYTNWSPAEHDHTP